MTLFQTRSEENGIKEFHSLNDALNECESDKSIWKISFTLDTQERVRLVKTGHGWILQDIYGNEYLQKNN